MQAWTVPAIALLLGLAGCTGPDTGPEESDGDPAGPSTPTPPSGPTTPTSPPGGQGFAPQHHHAEDAEAGLRAEGDLRPCEDRFCVDARAWNDGERTYHVSDICVPAWGERLTRDGEPVQHREPMFHCQAFGTRPLPPGDQSVLNATWDGRVWDDGEGRRVPAPQGAYVWTLLFRAYEEADGGGSVELALEFPVIVGET